MGFFGKKWPETGNINSETTLTIDGHLRSGSPCINHCAGGSTNDIDCEARPYPGGSNYDTGADEFIDTDADGLPDWLEMLAVGSATGADPGTDDDLDGLTNLREYDNEHAGAITRRNQA